MIKITLPATSANLGPGFDTLGVALDIYNHFYVEKNDSLVIEGTSEEFRSEDNLFYQAYLKALKRKEGLYVRFDCRIPFSRGLGSSATLILGGILAANHLHHLALSMEEIFDIAAAMEGHPDNIAPCLFGGLNASFMEDGKAYTTIIKVDPKFRFTVLIPDFEVSTHEARKVLRQEVSLTDSIFNASHALSLAFALQNGDENILKLSAKDKLHEPYRKALIRDFDQLKEEAFRNHALAFLISGSGSCLLAISLDTMEDKFALSGLKNNWIIRDVRISEGPPRIETI